MNNFTKRALTGAIYVALTVFCLLFSMDTAFIYLFLINLFCLYELYSLLNPEQGKLSKIMPLVVSAFLFFYFLIGSDYAMFPGDLEGMIMVVLLSLLVAQVFTKNEKPFQYLGTVFLSFFYITFSFILLLRTGIDYDEFLLSSDFFTGEKVLVLFILIWASDTFAYLAGRAFGRHKLVPKLSPGKTVEGAIGGWIGTLLTAWLLHETIGQYNMEQYMIIGSLVFIFGLLGDLLVSRFKRSIGVKDSGNLLPGHGGFLDRFDSVLLAGPVVYLYLSFI